MRSSTAYFAGAGTVIAAIAAGLGGGYLFFSIVSPHPEKHGSSEVSRLERRMSTDPIPAANKGSPEPVPYLDKPQISAVVAEPAQPQQASSTQQQEAAMSQPQAQPQQFQPQQAQRQQAPAQQIPAQPAAAAPSSPPAPAAAQPVAAVEQPATREKSSAPDDSFARARDADVRRDARREAREERRKAERERRQQWSERRKWRQRDDDVELAEVERKVREETEPRRIREDGGSRPFFASEPARGELPRIRLFDMD